MMKTLQTTKNIVVLFALAIAPLCADTVELKTGERVDCKFVSSSDGVVLVMIDGAQHRIDENRVKGISIAAQPTPAPTPTKSKQPTLTQDDEQCAYNVSVQWIATHLKAPSTAQYQPIQDVQFSIGRWSKGSLNVHLYVDAQNSYGVMLRELYLCKASPVSGTIWKAVCFSGM